jgi:hypothetical protein
MVPEISSRAVRPTSSALPFRAANVVRNGGRADAFQATPNLVRFARLCQTLKLAANAVHLAPARVLHRRGGDRKHNAGFRAHPYLPALDLDCDRAPREGVAGSAVHPPPCPGPLAYSRWHGPLRGRERLIAQAEAALYTTASETSGTVRGLSRWLHGLLRPRWSSRSSRTPPPAPSWSKQICPLKT